jgi:hypothetical protein
MAAEPATSRALASYRDTLRLFDALATLISAQSGGGLMRLSGAGMASPHVAGVAALWAARQLGKSGAVRRATIKSQLEGRADRDRLETGADIADVGNGPVCAPRD